MMRGLAAALLNRRHHAFAGHSGNGRFAGRINIQDENAVGIGEGGAEFVKQVTRASVAVWLGDDVDALETALPSSSQGGANLGGMVAVIVNHAYAGGVSTQLETTIHTAETLQTVTNQIGGNVQPHAHRHGGGGIQHVVSARDVQME